jgi:hypothetical protein
VVKVTTQPIKLTKVPLKYLCIIYSSFKHRAHDCLKKTKVQNMFWTKPTTTAVIVTSFLKLDNVPINVVVAITTHSQVPN